MLLGIPYHVALAYRSGQDWIVRSGEGSTLFTTMAELIHIFRMPAFFIVAGYFAALLLGRKDPDLWLSSRIRRLGMPFAASLLLLIPVLNIACELSNFPPRQAFQSFWANATTSGGYWIRHLWFIIVLLYCSTAAAIFIRRNPGFATARISPHVEERLSRAFPAFVIGTAFALGMWEAGVIELFYSAGLATNFWQQILRLDDFLTYAPWFVVGFLLQRAPLLLQSFCRFSLPVACVAVAGVILSLLAHDVLPPIGRFLDAVTALTVTQLLFTFMKRFADRPHAVIDRLVAASFVIYLVHLPLVAILVDAGQRVTLPVILKAPVVMVLTLFLSYGAWMAVRRFPLLGFLFDGRPIDYSLQRADRMAVMR